MENKFVYLVVGTTHEWSDAWRVAAYTNEKQAQEHAGILNNVVKNAKDWKRNDRYGFRTEFDPNVRIGLNGTEYRVEKLLLVSSVDEFLDEARQLGLFPDE